MALIGFAMLCVTAVVALAPVIPELWARMLLVSVIYLLFGGAFASLFLLRLRRAASNVRAPLAMRNARETLEAVRGELKHG